MNELREIRLHNGDILTLSLDQIESTEIPDPKLVRTKGYIRTKSGKEWKLSRQEAVEVTMDWHNWMDSSSVSVG